MSRGSLINQLRDRHGETRSCIYLSEALALMGVSELVPKCCHSDVVKSDTDRGTNTIEWVVLMRIIQLFTFSHLTHLLENSALEN